MARDAKKCASEGLKEKKKQLLASCKAKRKAIKVAALHKKASPLTLSTPGSALSESSGICSFFPKKSKLTADHSTPSGGSTLLPSTQSPQRKSDSPKKRALLNQAPTSTPPCSVLPCDSLATLSSSTSGSWTGSEDESEDDSSPEGSDEEDFIDRMVSNWARGHLLPPVPSKATGKSLQDRFWFPHVIGIPPEVAPGLKPTNRSIKEFSNGVRYGIWPGTKHLSMLEDFIYLHFDGDDDKYWDFGVWALDVYFNNPTKIPTVHMRKSLDSKLSKNKATFRFSKEATMDSTELSSQAYSGRLTVAGPGSVVDLSQENMDTSSDGGNSGHHGNLFGGTVFNNPSFLARKLTPEEQARDLQWDGEERANDLKAAVKAAQICSKTLDHLARIKKTLVPEDHLGMNNEELTKDDGGAMLIKKISDRRKREPKQWWEELVGAATKVIPPPAVAAPLVITPTPLSTVEEASSTPVHSRPVQAPRSITPKASQLSFAFALV